MGPVSEQQLEYELRVDVEHSTLHVMVCPITHDAATGETTLYRRLTVRAVYEATESPAVTEFSLSPPGVPPEGSVDTTAIVSNVTDSSIDLTAVFRSLPITGFRITL